MGKKADAFRNGEGFKPLLMEKLTFDLLKTVKRLMESQSFGFYGRCQCPYPLWGSCHPNGPFMNGLPTAI